MTLDDYQVAARTTDRAADKALAFPLLGLFGEVGTLLSVVKKKQRDAASYIGYAPHVIEELGDVLWYFCAIADRAGIRLSDIGHNVGRSLQNWNDTGNTSLRFAELQPDIKSAPPTPTQAFENTLLDLAGEVGTVLSDYQAGRIKDNQAVLKGRLVAVLRVLVRASNEAGVTLGEAAQSNLKKIFDRWPKEYVYPDPSDKHDKPFEQLPRTLTIDIIEREVAVRVPAMQRDQYRRSPDGQRARTGRLSVPRRIPLRVRCCSHMVTGNAILVAPQAEEQAKNRRGRRRRARRPDRGRRCHVDLRSGEAA
jgi:NTP pyrophosphatase (non-canonical NTP hydrolase)